MWGQERVLVHRWTQVTEDIQMLITAAQQGVSVPAGDDQQLFPTTAGSQWVSPSAMHNAAFPTWACEQVAPTELHEGLPNAGTYHILTAVCNQVPATATCDQVPTTTTGDQVPTATGDKVPATTTGDQVSTTATTGDQMPATRDQVPATATDDQVLPWAGNKGELLTETCRQMLAVTGGSQVQELINTKPKQVQVSLHTYHPALTTASHRRSETFMPPQEESLWIKMAVLKEIKK